MATRKPLPHFGVRASWRFEEGNCLGCTKKRTQCDEAPAHVSTLHKCSASGNGCGHPASEPQTTRVTGPMRYCWMKPIRCQNIQHQGCDCGYVAPVVPSKEHLPTLERIHSLPSDNSGCMRSLPCLPCADASTQCQAHFSYCV